MEKSFLSLVDHPSLKYSVRNKNTAIQISHDSVAYSGFNRTITDFLVMRLLLTPIYSIKFLLTLYTIQTISNNSIGKTLEAG